MGAHLRAVRAAALLLAALLLAALAALLLAALIASRRLGAFLGAFPSLAVTMVAFAVLGALTAGFAVVAWAAIAFRFAAFHGFLGHAQQMAVARDPAFDDGAVGELDGQHAAFERHHFASRFRAALRAFAAGAFRSFGRFLASLDGFFAEQRGGREPDEARPLGAMAAVAEAARMTAATAPASAPGVARVMAAGMVAAVGAVAARAVVAVRKRSARNRERQRERAHHRDQDPSHGVAPSLAASMAAVSESMYP